MSWHFNNDHPIDCLSVTPVEKVSDDISPKEAERELQRLETLRLVTQQPMGINSLVQDSYFAGLQYFRRHSWCTVSPGAEWIVSSLVSLAWLMVVLPFSVDAGDVPRGCLQMTQTSIAQRRGSNWHKSDHMALLVSCGLIRS